MRRSASGRSRRERGFTMLVVLLVGAVAALASASLVAAALSASMTDAADRGRDACAAAADAAVTQLVEQVRWGAAAASFMAVVEADDLRPPVETAMQVAPGVSADDGAVFTALDLTAESRACGARVARRLSVRLRPGTVPHGLAATGDLVVLAPIEIVGCGVYVGGDVVGREWIAFGNSTSDADGAVEALAPPDLLHPELYALAAVHAGGAIYTAEGEIHDLPEPTLDTDVHVGEPFAADLAAQPTTAALARLRQHSIEPGDALSDPFGDATLHVDLLPSQPPAGADPHAGFIVYVAEDDRRGPLLVTGVRLEPPFACPVVVIVEGDTILGGEPLEDGDAPVCTFSGALLSTGALSVAAPTRMTGSLAAAEIVAAAPLCLTLDDEWLAWPPAGCRAFEVLRRS